MVIWNCVMLASVAMSLRLLLLLPGLFSAVSIGTSRSDATCATVVPGAGRRYLEKVSSGGTS
jgi:hypothetical protein